MQNNINTGGGRRQVLSSVDFYRRVPKDLTEATTLGAIMSIVAMSIMGILFLCETIAFAKNNIVTSIVVDNNDNNNESQIRINFNITLLDLHCDYVRVDVWDALGTNRQNVTKNIDKWQLDNNGIRRIFSGRNRETREVSNEDHHPDDLSQYINSGTVVTLTSENFNDFLDNNPMAFIDLYAPWCVWCQRLTPTWEKFALQAKEEGMPIGIGKVDCMTEADLCREQRIMAFPTLRWYHDGQPVSPDYKMDRTVTAFYTYAKRKLEMDDKFKEWNTATGNKDVSDEERTKKRELFQQHRPEHPGCQVSGHLMVNRVPGNFHIEAGSKNHNLNAAMTNLSHIVNSLSFGTFMDSSSSSSSSDNNSNERKLKRILKRVPDEHKHFTPLDTKQYITKDYHQSFHHYIKVVSTHLNMGSSKNNQMITYQFLEQSQIVFYDTNSVPEARFSYDLSPMSVIVAKESRKWYDYLTSVCAIIGGTFTTLGLIDATLYKIFKPKKL